MGDVGDTGETGSLSEALGWEEEGAGRARLGPRPPPLAALAALAPPRGRGAGWGQLQRLWLPSLACTRPLPNRNCPLSIPSCSPSSPLMKMFWN